jgi:hypothetical protein
MEPESRLSSRECVNHPYFEGLKEEFGVTADFEPIPSETTAPAVLPLSTVPLRPSSGVTSSTARFRDSSGGGYGGSGDDASGNTSTAKTSPLASRSGGNGGGGENVAPKAAYVQACTSRVLDKHYDVVSLMVDVM